MTLAVVIGVAGQELVWSQAGTPESSPEATPTAMITPAPDAPRIVLDFETLNDSGLSGTATLYEAGDRTIVDLDVKNTGNDQPAHIHAGQCGALTAEPAFDLTSLGADGTSRTVIDTPLEGLLNGDFAVDIHLSPNELGTLSACANIEGTPSVPSETTPVATPSAEPTGAGGESTTPTATTSTETPAATSTETAAATTTVATATATTATTGSTGTNGDGTGGNTGSTTTTTNTTSGSTTTTTTTTGTTGSTTSSAPTVSRSTTSDGTGAGATTSNGSTYLANDGTVKTADMAASGTGPLGIVPERMDPTVFWSIVSAALLLLASSAWIWLGERRSAHSHRQPPRWSRLGM